MKSSVTLRMLLATVVAILSLSVSAGHAAAVDYFLKIEGIDGESRVEGHEEWIDVVSFTQTAASPGGTSTRGGGGGAGKVEFSDIMVMKQIDKATPKLMLACATGQHIPRARLVCRREGEGGQQEAFLEIHLENILITSWSTEGHTEEHPMESISISFDRITLIYRTFHPTGELAAEVVRGWDIKAKQAI